MPTRRRDAAFLIERKLPAEKEVRHFDRSPTSW